LYFRTSAADINLVDENMKTLNEEDKSLFFSSRKGGTKINVEKGNYAYS
jgi:hypothetical protein